MSEYVIFGVEPENSFETVLLRQYQGEPITNYDFALKIKAVLEKKHHCRNVRIHQVTLDGLAIANQFKAIGQQASQEFAKRCQ